MNAFMRGASRLLSTLGDEARRYADRTEYATLWEQHAAVVQHKEGVFERHHSSRISIAIVRAEHARAELQLDKHMTARRNRTLTLRVLQATRS